jgi:hypothetical protein
MTRSIPRALLFSLARGFGSDWNWIRRRLGGTYPLTSVSNSSILPAHGSGAFWKAVETVMGSMKLLVLKELLGK